MIDPTLTLVFVGLILAFVFFFRDYRVVIHKEEVFDERELVGTVVHADNILELRHELYKLPDDTDITKLWILPKPEETETPIGVSNENQGDR